MNDTEIEDVQEELRAFGPWSFGTVAVVFTLAALYALAGQDVVLPEVSMPVWLVFVLGWGVALWVGGRAREIAVGVLLGAFGMMLPALLYPAILVLAVALPATAVWAVVVAVRRRRRPAGTGAAPSG
ncbi:hypothetical protein [Nocardia sp. AG03]|uniref:hypothetical protein n=1 Tax=Nocardia sp. AG03 TaxID=3025312 RepID=UPI0024183F2D|nr:hypothetical protein [Nocardia sp. AG03]